MNLDHTRFWHYLKANKRSATPSNFAFVATSYSSRQGAKFDQQYIHTLDNWCATGVRYEKGSWTRRASSNGETGLSFWLWLYSRLDKRRPLWLWGYSISQSLQLLSFGWEIEHGNIEWQTVDYQLNTNKSLQQCVTWQGVIILDDPPTVIELRHPKSGSKLWILDTLNFWRCSREEFTNNYGAFTKEVKDSSGSVAKSSITCQVECKSIETSITQLVHTVRSRDLGNLRWTAAAQGLQCWRHRFLKHKILVHCDETALKLERDSYFGGNVSLFRYGVVKGSIYVVDYQSCYPAIMGSRVVPTRLLGSATDRVRCSDLSWCRDCWRIAHVTLNTPDVTFPVRYRGRLVLATGIYTTTLQEPELQRAINLGVITGIHGIAWYTRDIIFKGFVETLWKMRYDAISAGNAIEANFYKLLLNGVPGKLGQKQIQWVDEPTYHATKPWGTETILNADTGKTEQLRYLNWRVQRLRRKGETLATIGEDGITPVNAFGDPVPIGPTINDESKRSLPQIAGAITSWGRVLLEETINEAGRENVYYTDTDCLHVNEKGLVRLERAGKVRPDSLGYLAIKAIAEEAEYRGVKYYRLDDEWTIAGKKEISSPHVDGRWEQEQFSGLSSMFYDGHCGELYSDIVKCERTNEFIPGVMQPDGSVTPIRLAHPAETDSPCAATN